MKRGKKRKLRLVVNNPQPPKPKPKKPMTAAEVALAMADMSRIANNSGLVVVFGGDQIYLVVDVIVTASENMALIVQEALTKK
ncbi:MAG: hypothetical protein ACWGQW_10030 [bacterium]